MFVYVSMCEHICVCEYAHVDASMSVCCCVKVTEHQKACLLWAGGSASTGYRTRSSTSARCCTTIRMRKPHSNTTSSMMMVSSCPMVTCLTWLVACDHQHGLLHINVLLARTKFAFKPCSHTSSCTCKAGCFQQVDSILLYVFYGKKIN